MFISVAKYYVNDMYASSSPLRGSGDDRIWREPIICEEEFVPLVMKNSMIGMF